LDFFGLYSISSEIELGLEPSQIKILLNYISSFFEDFFQLLLSLELIQCYILVVQRIKKTNWSKKNKMADKIKMAAKHEFSIA
jgi:hypothetical protein